MEEDPTMREKSPSWTRRNDVLKRIISTTRRISELEKSVCEYIEHNGHTIGVHESYEACAQRLPEIAPILEYAERRLSTICIALPRKKRNWGKS